jgi:hypothetical protein
MRKTLDIDADMLAAAKALAQSGHSTAGRVISDLMRCAITRDLANSNAPLVARKVAEPEHEPETVYGFSPLTNGGNIVTNDIVHAIRNRLGD